MATDAELNQYMSVKKYAPYRKDLKWDPARGDRLKQLKQQISERNGPGMNMDEEGTGSGGRQGKKRKGKKERMKMKTGAPEVEGTEHGEIKVKAKPLKKGDEVGGGGDDSKRKRGSAQVDEDEQEDRKIGKKRRRRHKKKIDPSES
jgi:protein KRI1